ncbi:hypothetical protein Tco_1175669 [Tanacetum coccineum]
MELKDTLSSCSDSEKQDMQQMLKRAKILKDSYLNGLSALKSNLTQKHEQGITKSEFERAFSNIFGEDVDTFTRTFSQNMDTLEQQLTKETILESNCQNAFRVLKTQFEKIFTSVLINPSSLDGTYARKDFHAYTVQEEKASDAISEDKAQEHCMISFRLLHLHLKLLSNNDLKGTRTEYGFKHAFATLFGQDLETFTGTMVNERHMQTTDEKVNSSKALDASLVDTESNGTESEEQDTSSRSRNDAHADDADIRPLYDEEPMTEVQKTVEINVFATGQQHTEQPKFNNKGEVDQNAEQCHDTCPLPTKLTDTRQLNSQINPSNL